MKPLSFGDWNTDYHKKKGCFSWKVGINMAYHLTHQTVKLLKFHFPRQIKSNCCLSLLILVGTTSSESDCLCIVCVLKGNAWKQVLSLLWFTVHHVKVSVLMAVNYPAVHYPVVHLILLLNIFTILESENRIWRNGMARYLRDGTLS